MLDKKEQTVVYLGSDHAGYEEKNQLREYLVGEDYKVIDLGVFSNASFDYPDIAREVGEKVRESEGSFGILICGSGIGVCIAANKMKGIRAATCNTVEMAEMARNHNDANVVTMGSRVIAVEEIKKIAKAFLTTEFDGGERHQRRVKKMMDLEDLNGEK